tara:strand:- start:27 stop:227 length:201 start_codon:yes stop_codon:yes gene_type:complete
MIGLGLGHVVQLGAHVDGASGGELGGLQGRLQDVEVRAGGEREQALRFTQKCRSHQYTTKHPRTPL